MVARGKRRGGGGGGCLNKTRQGRQGVGLGAPPSSKRRVRWAPPSHCDGGQSRWWGQSICVQRGGAGGRGVWAAAARAAGFLLYYIICNEGLLGQKCCFLCVWVSSAQVRFGQEGAAPSAHVKQKKTPCAMCVWAPDRMQVCVCVCEGGERAEAAPRFARREHVCAPSPRRQGCRREKRGAPLCPRPISARTHCLLCADQAGQCVRREKGGKRKRKKPGPAR